jgi:N-acetylmuramoyl-L-alanine amidase
MAERGTLYPSQYLPQRHALYVQGGVAEIGHEKLSKAERCSVAIGGGPVLISNGIATNLRESILAGNFSGLNENGITQRNAMGIDGSGNIVHIVSAGMTLREVQNNLLAQGCVAAINLDGGGSVVWLEDGKTKYRADPQWMRKVPSCLVMRDVLQAKKTVLLCAGHGGADPGAVANGLREADLTERITAAAAYYLSQRNVDARTTSRGTIDARIAECNRLKPHGYIMIHCNAATAESANGIETYYWYTSANGRRLAQNLQDKTLSATGLAKRIGSPKPSTGGTSGYYRGLRYTSCPAAIIEAGFVTNSRDAAWLSNSVNLELAGRGIAEGIIDWLTL